MASLAVVPTNLIDDVTLTASDAEIQMPVSRLQIPHVLRKWRSTTTTPYLLTSLFGPFDTISLWGITASEDCTIRVGVSSSDPTGAARDLYDSDDDYPGGIEHGDAPFSADLDGRGGLAILLPASVTGYLRIDFNEAGTGRTNVEAGRPCVGLRTQFAYNFVPGASVGWRDKSITAETLGGQTLTWRKPKARILNFNLDWITATQRHGVVDTMDRVNGLTDDVLFVLDPDSTNLPRDSILGLATDLTPAAYQNIYDANGPLFSKSWQIKERL